jgi:hypothetical protein
VTRVLEQPPETGGGTQPGGTAENVFGVRVSAVLADE